MCHANGMKPYTCARPICIKRLRSVIVRLNHFATRHNCSVIVVQTRRIFHEAMSNARNLSFSSRKNSLSSLSSSMESLSSTHADSYWSIDQYQDLVPTSSAFTIPRPKVKTSDYDTGFSTAENDEDKKQSKKVAGRVRKVRAR